MNSFVRSQQKTVHHQLAIWLIPFIVFIGYLYPYLFWAGLVIFFLVTSFKLLKSMLFWMLVLGGLSMLIPPLAPIIFVIMIIFFIMRIGFVIQNWRPFLYGIIFYSFMAFLVFDTYEFYNYHDGIVIHLVFYFEGFSDLYWQYSDYIWIVNGAVMALISTVMLHIMLRNCYQYGYESYFALGVMGSAPLIIISFLLPFLKIHVGDSIVGDSIVGESYISENTPVPTEKTFVDPYVRTAPDGIAQNNYSYDGPDKLPPNSETVEVKGYWRSVSGETTVPQEPINTTSNVSTGELALLPGKEKEKGKTTLSEATSKN